MEISLPYMGPPSHRYVRRIERAYPGVPMQALKPMINDMWDIQRDYIRKYSLGGLAGVGLGMLFALMGRGVSRVFLPVLGGLIGMSAASLASYRELIGRSMALNLKYPNLLAHNINVVKYGNLNRLAGLTDPQFPADTFERRNGTVQMIPTMVGVNHDPHAGAIAGNGWEDYRPGIHPFIQ